MSTSELVIQLKAGNRDAFDALYERYKDKALRTSVFIAGNLQDGEDIVQETFVKCYLHIHDLKNNEGFQAWMYQILTRTAWRFCKNRKHEISTEEIPEGNRDSGETSPPEKMIHMEQKTIIYQMIQKLDLKHRTVVILYYYNEMQIKEIAEAVGCLEGTVKSRLYTARKILKKHLGENFSGKEWFYETI